MELGRITQIGSFLLIANEPYEVSLLKSSSKLFFDPKIFFGNSVFFSSFLSFLSLSFFLDNREVAGGFLNDPTEIDSFWCKEVSKR